MNENSELLLYIYQDCKMGIESMTTLIRSINNTDNKIKKVVEGQLKGYEHYLNDCEKLMKKNKVTPQDKGPMAKMGAYMGIKWELMKDNSDARIADMLTKGFTMGTIDMKKKIEMFKKDADSDIINLAKEFLNFQEENIKFLKDYL